MENTKNNAKIFLRQELAKQGYNFNINPVAKLLVAYCAACSAPSSIGEDVQEEVRQILAKTCTKNETLSGIETTWNWSDQAKAVCDYFRSRLSERKIVKDGSGKG